MKYLVKHTPLQIGKNELAFELKDIEKIYHGKGNNCRCGCAGSYIYKESDPHKAKEMADKFVELAQKRKVTSISEHILEVNASDSGRKDEVLTIYLDEDKFRNDKVFVAQMPGVFGYGLMLVHTDEDAARRLLEKAYDKANESRKFDKTFEEAMDFFGGSVKSIKPHKVYFDGFAE